MVSAGMQKGGCTSFYGLYVPLDRVLFLSSLFSTGYTVSRETTLNGIYNFVQVRTNYKYH